MNRFLLACGGLVASLFARTSADLATIPQAHVLTVSPAAGHYSEPGIAINPRNPKQIVVVFQGGKSIQGTANAAYSTDGGHTFTLAQGTPSPDWKVLGDVSTTFDSSGNAYVCSIAFDKLGTTSYWAHNVGRNGIIVRRSRNGGRSWDTSASNVKTFFQGNESDIQFEDEPRIYADNSPASPHFGTLYVGWVEWQLTQSVMFVSRSTDHAATWSRPVRISTKAGLPRDDNGGLGGYTQATAPDGTIYAAWSDGDNIIMAVSHNGGISFDSSHPVVRTGPTYFGDVPGVSRVEGCPVLATDMRRGHTGQLYLCWSDYTNGDVDVFVSSSHNKGINWSLPVRVNSDPVHDGKDQFYQWLVVDSVTGNLFVDFYDRRADPANNLIRLTLAQSTDEGRTFRNFALTTTPFKPARAFLGDYTWLDSFNNHVAVAWTEPVPNASGPDPQTIVKVATTDFH
jgi:hypothetical protein